MAPLVGTGDEKLSSKQRDIAIFNLDSYCGCFGDHCIIDEQEKTEVLKACPLDTIIHTIAF